MGELPELVQAIGIAIAAIIGAWTAWQGRQIKILREEMNELRNQVTQGNKKMRIAVGHIREWIRWDMKPEPKGPSPVLPDELIDEV